MLSANAELDKFLNRRSRLFFDALTNLAESRMGNDLDYNLALGDVARLLHDTIILTRLSGAKRVWMEYDSAKAHATFTSIPQRNPIVYGATFHEAVEDLLQREPRVVPDHIPFNQRAEWVSNLYSKSAAFAAARSIDAKLTARIQKAVADSVEKGLDPGTTERQVMRLAVDASHDWSRAYANTVYRTNVARAYTEGRFAQAAQEDVKEVIPALEYVSVEDALVRPNHAAAHGLIAATDDPVWEMIKPPNGYNCRCAANFISRFELERRGLFKDGRVTRYEPPTFQQAHRDGPPFEPTTQF